MLVSFFCLSSSKIVGRKIIKQISPFTFITSIILSEMLGNAMYEENLKTLLLRRTG
ncbi:hypothetical protein V7127_04275 [Bacillus sp. JJ1773]|uniref:hypothetical protein n=1 Tax=Bacillus sp. JJ1773 TaxID=3122965 RepID=UPI002FFF1816